MLNKFKGCYFPITPAKPFKIKMGNCPNHSTESAKPIHQKPYTMTINHLNLVVNDLVQTIKFFETFFEFTLKDIKGDNIIAVLENKENFTLVIMSSKNQELSYPKDFHFGFILESKIAVDTLHQKLQAAGFQIENNPRTIRNSYTFYLSFDNLFIEIGHYLPTAA